MKTYNSYEAAKIANPELEISISMSGIFAASDYVANIALSGCVQGWNKCNPADHCMTLGELRDKHGGEIGGDIILGYGTGKVRTITQREAEVEDFDCDNFVLRAAAWENQMNIDKLATQTPEEKEVLDAVDFSRACEIGRSKLKSNPVIQLSIDEIDKFSGEAEWNGEGLPPVGVECNFSGINKDYDCKVEIYHIDENKVMFLGLADGYPEKSTIRGFKNNLDLMVFYQRDGDCVFTPIESKKDREERERLEAAYDLYCDAQHAVNVIGYDDYDLFKKNNVQVNFWLAIVDKTNYRKESN